MQTRKVPVLLSRRASLGLFTAVGGSLLVGCGNTPSSTSSDGGTGGTDGDTSGGDGGGTTSETGAGTGTASSWARGGTKSMSGAYADPFPTAVASCVLATTATEGPCTEAADQIRKDVSEGYTGLPMRLALRVVDASCNAIAGAKVKIWHTQITGSYSGNTPNNAMCLKDSAESAKHYFRGVQTTDANGRVDFDSCFPGWYRGRAVHIHFTVSRNGRAFTSQLVFEQALVNEIFAGHPEYAGYGAPDTPNASDNVVGRGDLATYTLATSRMADGALMAAKVLVVSV